jgi:hypothetical protein
MNTCTLFLLAAIYFTHPLSLPPSRPHRLYPKTRPATALALLSFVSVFLNPFPAWICPSNAPISPVPDRAGAEGMGGGGGGPPGASLPGKGGGGGGALGAPLSKPGGGGGGGAALGAPKPGIGGGGGAEVDSNAPGAGGASCTGVAGLLSMLESGRGGAMVPKRMEASCLADPPPGRSSSSSSLSSLSDPAADHSSSSGRRRDCGPVTVGVNGFALSCWAMRWNGFVDGRLSAGGAGGAVVCGIGGGENTGRPFSDGWV